MTIYDINILEYDDQRSYKKDNIITKDGMFYQALKDIESDDVFNISDWKVINDPDKLYGLKLFPDYLNLIDANKPLSNDIPDNNNYTCIVKEAGIFKQYYTVDKGVTWIPKPIDNYNNLSIYLLADKFKYATNDELSKNLNKLQIDDGLSEIVFRHNFQYPITDHSIAHRLEFNKCIIEFSKDPVENWITIAAGAGLWVLIDANGVAQNINSDSTVPDWLHWNPGTLTLEFDKEIILESMVDADGNSILINNLPDLADYIPFKDIWIKNDQIIEISYNNKGNDVKILNYTPNDLIKQIIIDNDNPQILNPIDKKLLYLL